MSIWQQTRTDDVYLIGVNDRIDQSQTPQLEATLSQTLEKGHRYLIVDLTEATYINSGGLRCLVSAWRKAQERNGDLVLCGLNARLNEIFSMVGFDKVFHIYSDVSAAHAGLTGRTAAPSPPDTN